MVWSTVLCDPTITITVYTQAFIYAVRSSNKLALMGRIKYKGGRTNVAVAKLTVFTMKWRTSKYSPFRRNPSWNTQEGRGIEHKGIFREKEIGAGAKPGKPVGARPGTPVDGPPSSAYAGRACGTQSPAFSSEKTSSLPPPSLSRPITRDQTLTQTKLQLPIPNWNRKT